MTAFELPREHRIGNFRTRRPKQKQTTAETKREQWDRSRKTPNYTSIEDAEILRRKHSGQGSAEIAAALGRSRHGISARARALGSPFPKGSDLIRVRKAPFKPMPQLICVSCRRDFNKPYRISKSRVSKKHFCSTECRIKWQSRNYADIQQSLAPRFWANVSIGREQACWEWQGRRDQHGYGRFDARDPGDAKKRPFPRLAHRVAYSLHLGLERLPAHICHSCDNPPCCNPNHLWLGTDKDNSDDKIAKGRYRNGKTGKLSGSTHAR